MVIVLIVACVLAGMSVGYAFRAQRELREVRSQIFRHQQEELHLTDTIATLRAEVAAHETSLSMIMEEVNK